MASYSLKPIVDVCKKNWVWHGQIDLWMNFFQLTDINCGILLKKQTKCDQKGHDQIHVFCISQVVNVKKA